jgi:hypothetical protein
VTLLLCRYVAKFNPALMEITYAWCRGAKFIDILKMAPSMFEGNIIRCAIMRDVLNGVGRGCRCRYTVPMPIHRCMRRLDEVLGQVCALASCSRFSCTSRDPSHPRSPRLRAR